MDRRTTNRWLTRLGYFSLATAVIVLVADLIGWAVVEKHNPIAETISKLAIGRYSMILDIALDIYAVGIAAIAISMFLRSKVMQHAGGWKWKTAAGLLILTALNILVISEYDQYAGFDGFGYRVHRWCCFSLYGLVAASAVLLALELKHIDNGQRKATMVFLAVWLIGGPLFMFVVPTDIDGGVERAVAISLVAWTSGLAWMQVKAGRANSAMD